MDLLFPCLGSDDGVIYSEFLNNPSSRINNSSRRIIISGTILGAIYGRIYCAINGTINLTIHDYGFRTSGAAAEGARPTVVEAAEGRLHNGGW